MLKQSVTAKQIKHALDLEESDPTWSLQLNSTWMACVSQPYFEPSTQFYMDGLCLWQHRRRILSHTTVAGLS